MKHNFTDDELEERIAFHRKEEDRHHDARQEWEMVLRARNAIRHIASRNAERKASAEFQQAIAASFQPSTERDAIAAETAKVCRRL